jgi:serine phosphatase RsbU (regulator of sigma subunit)
MRYRLYILLLLFSIPEKIFPQKKLAADSLKILLSKSIDDTTRIRATNDLAYEYSADKPEDCINLATKALEMSEKRGYTFGKINAYNNIGLASYYSSDYEKALNYFNKALTEATKVNNKNKMSVALNNLGLVYDDKADYKKALEYYIKSLKIAEADGDSKWQLGSTYNNIALIYKTLGNYDEALNYHNKSLKIKQEVGNQKGVGSSLHNIGLVYKLKGEFEKSLEYNFKALEIRKAINDESGTALTLNNIGSVYESMGETEKALTYFLESLKIREHLKDNYNLAITLFSIGTNYCNKKEYTKGFQFLDKAMSISKELGAKELIKYGYETYTETFSSMGNYQKAFEYQTLLLNIKDSILNAENTKQLNELKTKYESEKRQKELELVTKESEIQTLQLNRNKMFMYVLIISILLILILSVFLFNRYKLKQKANELLEIRNIEITQQKKEITDSINYAKRIQESILPPSSHWKSMLPGSFIFYRPKDIVSGDFYWIEQKNEYVCFAAVDCTGHGVPGALMSVVGFNLLTQAVNEVGLTEPAEILKHLDAGVTKTLRQSEEGKGVKDGMDLSLCTLNTITNELQYAGAFNSLYYVQKNQLHEIKADKFPIGINLDGIVDNYTNHKIQLSKGDAVYLFSDGYADQFGGVKGKKFKYNKLKELLLSVHNKSTYEQHKIISETFDKWKGSLEQVDDVVVIGVVI